MHYTTNTTGGVTVLTPLSVRAEMKWSLKPKRLAQSQLLAYFNEAAKNSDQ